EFLDSFARPHQVADLDPVSHLIARTTEFDVVGSSRQLRAEVPKNLLSELRSVDRKHPRQHHTNPVCGCVAAAKMLHEHFVVAVGRSRGSDYVLIDSPVMPGAVDGPA